MALKCLWIFIPPTSKSWGGNNVNDLETPVAFPGDAYKRAANSSVHVRLGFVAQVMQELAVLFGEDHASLRLGEKEVDDFLNMIHQMKDGLLSCMKNKKSRWNKKLYRYFKRLSSDVLEQKKNSAEAWEMIRREAIMHIFHASLLITT
ncbi:interferon phi 4 [Vanacampus margaritifer]